MTRIAYFATCAECGEEARTKSGVCAVCTIKYDYAAPPPEAALMGDECGCEDCLAAVPGEAVVDAGETTQAMGENGNG